MGSDSKLLVANDASVREVLRRLKIKVESYGDEWLLLPSLNAIALSKELGKLPTRPLLVQWSIQTSVDQIWISCFEKGREVRTLLYSEGAWTIRFGKSLPFEDQPRLKKWLTKRRLLASSDGYEVLNAFLGMTQAPEDDQNDELPHLKEELSQLKADVSTALDQLARKTRRESVYGVAAQLGEQGRIVLRAGTETGLKAAVAAEAKRSVLLRKSPLAKQLGLRWRIRHWRFAASLGRSKLPYLEELLLDRISFGDEVRRRFGVETAVGFCRAKWKNQTIGGYEKFSNARVVKRLLREIRDSGVQAKKALAELSAKDAFRAYGERVEVFSMLEEFRQDATEFFVAHPVAFAPFIIDALERDFKRHEGLTLAFTFRNARTLKRDQNLVARLERLSARHGGFNTFNPFLDVLANFGRQA